MYVDPVSHRGNSLLWDRAVVSTVAILWSQWLGASTAQEELNHHTPKWKISAKTWLGCGCPGLYISWQPPYQCADVPTNVCCCCLVDGANLGF